MADLRRAKCSDEQFTIATNEFRGGGGAERTEYHPGVAWDGLADA